MTTGSGVEGEPGQHIVSLRTSDQGRTWSPPVDIEPAAGPAASWVMPVKVPGGRIYVFYTYNIDQLTDVPGSNHPGAAKRVDTIGAYCYKFSDDGGLSWSAVRYQIPMRRTRLDRENGNNGEHLLFWGVGKPILAGDDVFLGFAKVGKWGIPGTMVRSQGAFLHSPNLQAEPDPSRHVWNLLPDADEGLRAPKGPISDEANLVELSDGALFATYRTIDGYPCHAYSRDRGKTWTPPAYMTYGPGRRKVKHPRAANFVRKFSNGKYLYWFHNHGGEPVHLAKWDAYQDRNPAWVLGGIEKDGQIHWSEPEILLYADDPKVRISYPDFLEEEGRIFVSETQKEIARIHEIDPSLLEMVWSQHERDVVARDALKLEITGDPVEPGTEVDIPHLPALADEGGFSVDLWVWFDELSPGQVIVDTRDVSGRGFALTTGSRSTLGLTLADGKSSFSWDNDPGTGPGTLKVGAWQHITATVDAGPRVVSFVVDGEFNDGGPIRQFGWGRLPAEISEVNGKPRAALATNLFGKLGAFRVFDRPLRTTEAVGNFRAGRPTP
jgi:hypothetical protein